MGSIKPLPDSVRNSMRSGIILFDFARVVEELIFNSLDAGATEVSVYVGVGTCYVKVGDDGCGISRDGLALLGERYMTSKFHDLAEMDTANGSFGFRGEALASISDVSLLEIVTKARGMPNGYRKVLKGSKCLYLGVNNDRKDVGTTVVVRDLFYNQPVRRKYMQSSLKKVLDSVKKCVLRIALVHSKVSFIVVDTESEDELLTTRPSSSLALLMSVFGIEDSDFLHELNMSSGALKLSGYISGPFYSLTIKAFQYVFEDINSRFICKGPIHKLLNHLATRFECLDPWKVNNISHKGMRYRPQACPAYILNLSCPMTLYDLTFEPSKTYVEFRDWFPILNFIENSIQQLWRENMTYSHATGTCRKDEMWKEDLSDIPESAVKNAIQKRKFSQELAVPHFKMLSLEVDHIFSGESDKVRFEEFCTNFSEIKEQETNTEFLCNPDYSLQSWNGSISKHETETQKFDSYFLTSDANSLLQHDSFLEDRVAARDRSCDHVKSHILNLGWQNETTEIRSIEVNESSENSLSMDNHKSCDALVDSSKNEPFLQICSLGRSLPLDRSFFSSEEGLEFPIDGLKAKRRRICSFETADMLKADARNYRFDIFPGTLQQHEASYSQKFPAHREGIDMLRDFDRLSGASEKSLLSHGKLFAKEKVLGYDSDGQTDSSDLAYQSNSELCSLSSDALFHATARDIAHFPDANSHEERMRLGKMTKYWHFADSQGKKGNYSYNIASKSCGEDNFISRCTSTMLDFEDYANTSAVSDFEDYIDTRKDTSKFLQGHDANDELCLEHSDISVSETKCFPSDLHSGGHKSDDKYESQENQFRFQDRKRGNFPKEQHNRSWSAPPFYRHKTRFISLRYHHSMMKEGNSQFPNSLISPENYDLKHLDFQPNYADDLIFWCSPMVKNEQGIMPDMKGNKKGERVKCSQFLWADDSPLEGLKPKEIQGPPDYATKWRNGCQQIADKNTSHNIDNQHNILDVSSGFLHLAGNSLVPHSLHKNCLEDAKVLHQVDKKFIPIVAGGTFAIIDQHAADERIRLEELRRKVLSGEAKTVTYLDAEKELILPEIGYQLLHNYAGQIREWGWICNSQVQGSGSFKKNLNILHRQPAIVTLLAVPCILGVNLSDGDLLEFLEQLADTDGSSTMPPSVLRVLNNKACRGAIMFGDSLLPSECALIVEELKRTSLCFQCAHGRPTTVPVVNLQELHKQMAKLKVLDDGSTGLWHGLSRQELSIKRAANRLRRARG